MLNQFARFFARHGHMPGRASQLTAILIGWIVAFTAQAEPIQTFELVERLGVSHPDQVVYFDLNSTVDASDCSLVNEKGQAVAFQITPSNKIAIRTDLPAGSRRHWELHGGAGNQEIAPQVVVTETKDYWQLTNDRTGVRIAKPTARESLLTRSPICGVRLEDGSWTATEPAYLSRPADAMQTICIMRGPLVAQVQVRYQLWRSELYTPKDKTTVPAGDGEYVCTITLEAGQPVIRFLEKSDVDVNWSFDVNEHLNATRGQYRGHHATSLEAGRSTDGVVYGEKNADGKRTGWGSTDATVELDFTSGVVNRLYQGRYPAMPHWNPWMVDTGFYWQFYNADGHNDNLVGMFHGRRSQLGRTGMSGVSLDTQPIGVADLDTAMDTRGQLHAVYQFGDVLRYQLFDASLKPAVAADLGKNLAHPSLSLDQEDKPHILAFDRAARTFVLINDGDVEQLSAAKLDGVEPLWQQGTFAIAGPRQFLLIFGEKQGEQGLFVLVRGRRGGAFKQIARLDMPPENLYLRRPGFTAHAYLPTVAVTPAHDLVIAYIRANGVPMVSLIPAQVNELSHSRQFAGGGSSGVALEPSGSYVAAACGNKIYFGTPADGARPINVDARMERNHRDPNRRNIAVNPPGERAILAHSYLPFTPYPTHKHVVSSLFVKDGEQWRPFDVANKLKLSWARTHYHKPTNRFLLIGRNQSGKLALYAANSTLDDTTLLHQLDGSKKNAASVYVRFQRAMPTGYSGKNILFEWYLFVGKKTRDVAHPDEVQAIGRQFNLHSGINVVDLQKVSGDFPDPPQGYGNLYASAEISKSIARKLQAEAAEGKTAYYRQIRAACGQGLYPLVELWRDPSPQNATAIYKQIDEYVDEYMNNLLHGGGVYRHTSVHFMAALQFSGYLPLIDQLLASDHITDEQRLRLKTSLSLMTFLLWNEDIVPMSFDKDVHYGLANMISMWLNARYSYTMMMSSDPQWEPQARYVNDLAAEQLNNSVFENGASNASVHYTVASVTPVLNLMQQLQMAGMTDHFAEHPRAKVFANFYMQMVAPRDSRYGGLRKLVCIGDGSTEHSVMHGQLGTAFARSNPQLSKQLMWMWQQMGSTHNNFFGSTVLRIDSDLPTEPAMLRSAHYEGSMSVLRYAYNQPHESAIWFVNGDGYFDHRHDDAGSMIIYALGSPMTLDWGPIYYPRVAGGFFHSGVIPQSKLVEPWDQDSTTLDNPPDPGARATWLQQGETQFIGGFEHSSSSVSSFKHNSNKSDLTWQRMVRLIHPNQMRPIIFINDEFGGNDLADDQMVATFNLMAEGAVQTPQGSIEPTVRRYFWRDKSKHALPSSTKAMPLPKGLHRFDFTGQREIDFDLYVDAASPQEFTLGNWGHDWTPSPDQNHYRKANDGKSFEENQHILRLRGRDGFQVLMLPRSKTDDAPRHSITKADAGWLIESDDSKLALSKGGYSYVGSNLQVISTFTDQSFASIGVHISGGPVEVTLQKDSGTITVTPGGEERSIQLPRGWQLADKKSRSVKFDRKQKTYQITPNVEEPLVLSIQKQ